MEPWHTAQSISATTSRIDIDYLKSLANHGLHPIKDTCTYVGHQTERRTLCGKTEYILYIYLAYANHM